MTDPFILTICVRGLIAMALATGGLYALNRGYKLFINEVGLKPDETVVAFGKTKISVKSVGALVMVTASFWGYLSFQCAPRTEGSQMKVAKQPDPANLAEQPDPVAELAELRIAVTRALLASQDKPAPQKFFQAVLSSTLDETLSSSAKKPRASTEYTYDTAGNLTGITGDRSPTMLFEYDTTGRLTRMRQPNTGRAVSYYYDSAGNRLSRTYADDVIFSYSYDSQGRVAKVESRKMEPLQFLRP